MNELESYRPTIEAINMNAAPLIRESTPEMARTIQTKLDTINKKYTNVNDRTKVNDYTTTTKFINLSVPNVYKSTYEHKDEERKRVETLRPIKNSLRGCEVSNKKSP